MLTTSCTYTRFELANLWVSKTKRTHTRFGLGSSQKICEVQTQRHCPRSAGWEGREVLVLIRTVCSQLMGFAKTCMIMTQPGFEPATFAFQTAAKTARLRKLLLQVRATISGYIPSITQLGFEPATLRNRNRNRTRCMTQPGFEPATSVFQTAAKTARLRELLLLT